MGQVLHGCATTTEAVRRAIQNSQESLRALAKRYGINQKTVAKWKQRKIVADLPTGPKEAKSTVLSIEEEAIIVAFRRHTLLPLDDCLYALQPTIPHLTRSSLHRCLQRQAGELTSVWVPDKGHEAMRDLVRARAAAVETLRVHRQQVSALMLRHGRQFPRKTTWTRSYLRWLQEQKFDHPAHQIVLQEAVEAVRLSTERLERLERSIEEFLSTWSLAPLVRALEALRGVSTIVAVTFVTEVGDLRRFDSPRQLMGYLGLVPSERSTGETVRRGPITKAGNGRARHMLVESAWTYRHPPRIGRVKLYKLEQAPPKVREIAWKAQARLTSRYRALCARGKRPTVICTAIARELAGFMWAIGREVQPAQS